MVISSDNQKSFSKQIVVCIPAFNEEKNILKVLSKIKDFTDEIVVYDDGSTDGTAEIAQKAGAAVIKNKKNKGYGKALSVLFQHALIKKPDIMITIDSDGQHDPNQIPQLIEPLLKDQADIVIGSRFLNQDDIKKVPSYRSIGIKAITRMTRVACYENITDAQSGFRAYNMNALSKLRLYEDGMAISTEILLKATESNLRIVEVPITIDYFEDSSTHNPIGHGISVVSHLLKHMSFKKPLIFYGIPGLILIIVAAIFMYNALDLFSNTRYVSTNMIILSLGFAIMGILLLATSAIIYTIISIFKGRLTEL
jgi:glycosyltransferase involved in cell wall biosynthesis